MKYIIKFFLPILILILLNACASEGKKFTSEVTSPDKNIKVSFHLSAENQPFYVVNYKTEKVIDSSKMGFELKDAAPLSGDFRIVATDTASVNETWQPVWGEDAEVKNEYNELKLQLEETSALKRKINIIFKVYDDGIGFRYEFPKQENLNEVVITDENTEFNLTGNHKVWWIPGDWDIYEYLYQTTKFSEIDALKLYEPGTHLGQTYMPENAVNTPVTMKTEAGLYLSFHEADLTDYAGMTLAVDTTNHKMKSELVGNAENIKVKRQTPFETPWRTIQIAEKPGQLIESKLIVNLNDPNVVEDMSFFKPTKYTGIWWDMHIGTGNWDYAGANHAANTTYAKELIDFSAKHNINAMLVEGWNIGWEQWWDKKAKQVDFDFVTPYPDYDLQEVVRYGKSKGVALIMHHETSADVTGYEAQIDTAFALMKDLKIHAVKTGYVGSVIPEGEYHHGQFMVNHYQKVLEKGIENQVAINAHEPIKATGKRRTYPVAISREGVRGQEYNAWSDDGGNPPEHLTIVPFTRMLGGPVDYTPGIFNTSLKPYKENNQINTTLAHQLALYVVVYSPVQMVPDLIKNYEGHPAFQFIEDVGIDWQQSKVLDAEIGDFIVMARQEKQTGHWFLGAITDEQARTVTINFDFLEAGKNYTATIYKDAADAHYKTNPEAYEISSEDISNNSKLELMLAAGGGVAIAIKESNK
ncbi:glycoside hydrolase family 97 protein [Subsaximicrobium wynnwilliamsii]|uniref:Glycoside hydrolase family 97 protein n=1 Tax=Subsaximicrobium wynnwilliamsii TaxID=291179 RepID=A0A5C6ZDP9_9FLAO|nr:glycoside hydrolase family 97 protein [Subsaximicrobium wynnwilliamsii]TXD81973.1 glycoside hydrolase family 97 protein [Subsaximicrobium wynnwilliamsii]TXD87671.1 glycoside hydrolase family 97 protein [Subsaximicrobium wynnwilliamsii]TXE01417.1 glycoside hydrolase family 97 protein [Subsaximicrobium wynnwilliamsii]